MAKEPAHSITSGSGVVHVRFGTGPDVGFAASLHTMAIAEGFLSQLGVRFLGLLYRRIVRSEDSFLLIAETNAGVPVGFLAGTMSVSTLYRSFILRDGIRVVVTAPKALILAWRRVFETLRYGGSRGTGQPDHAELLSVAVVPDWHHRHIGSLLVESFVHVVDSRGDHAVDVVVGETNTAAVALYTSKGFVLSERFELHRGTASLRLERSPVLRPQGP
jgi:ribosomal protein S18 acetylase RimI-like enzyme